MNDDELMRLVAEEDEMAFRELYSRWAARVMAYAARTLEDRMEAEDVVQEVFLNLYKSRKRYVRQGRFGSFLFRIAGNLVRSRFRGRVPEPFENLDGLIETSGYGATVEVRLDLEAALGALPFDQREALLLAVMGGLKYREIARISGCCEDAVAKRVSRARIRLRNSLAEKPSAGERGPVGAGGGARRG